MTSLPIAPEQIEAIELAARYCATLASVERAYALEDTDAVEAIFGGIDPVEVRLTANTLTAFSRLWRIILESRGATNGAGFDSPRQVESTSPDRVAPDLAAREQASAPQNVVQLRGSDNWRIDCA